MRPWMLPKLLLVFAALTVSEARCQFHSMPTGESLWVGSWCIGPGFPCSGWVYGYAELVNDTVINGVGYTRLNYSGAIRDDLAGMVFIVPYGLTQEHVLYDYTAQPGDTLNDLYSEIWGLHSQIVVTVDTVTINGEGRRRMGMSHLDSGGSVASNYWIQGVGSLTGPVQTCVCPSVSGGTALSCMSENGIALYGGAVGQVYDCLIHLGEAERSSQRLALELFPNPGAEELTISFGSASGSAMIRVFSMQGELVHAQAASSAVRLSSEHWPAGVYIVELDGEGAATRRGRWVKIR